MKIPTHKIIRIFDILVNLAMIATISNVHGSVYTIALLNPPPPPFKGGGGHFKSILLFYAIPPQINMTIGILINTYVLVRK